MSFPLPETITRWRKSSSDGVRWQWGAPVQYPGRIAYRQTEFTDTNGDRRASIAQAYTEGDVVVGDQVLFAASTAITPPAESNDVRSVSNTPSGAGALKKLWFA